jgi:hypothetical protein
MWKFILVFIIVTAADFLWAAYISHTAKGNIWKASSYAAAIALFSGLITIAYINDSRMIIPAVLGAFVGTYLCLKLKKD